MNEKVIVKYIKSNSINDKYIIMAFGVLPAYNLPIRDGMDMSRLNTYTLAGDPKAKAIHTEINYQHGFI